MSGAKDRIGGILLLIFCLVYGALTFEIERPAVIAETAMTARSLPYALTVLGVLLASWLILFPQDVPLTGWRALQWGRLAAFVALMVVYGMTLRPFGFVPATLIFLVCGFVLLGERRMRWLLGIGLSVTLVFWLLLSQGLGVYLEPWPGAF